MTIFIDSREKARAIKGIIKHFDSNSIKHISTKLYVGDYQNPEQPMLIIDRKQNLNEVCSNVCQDHKRFVDELQRANAINIKMIILIEHGCGINSLQDVNTWYNPRLKVSPLAVSGQRLFKILYAMSKKYNVEFLFCDKKSTGAEIVRLLSCTK